MSSAARTITYHATKGDPEIATHIIERSLRSGHLEEVKMIISDERKNFIDSVDIILKNGRLSLPQTGRILSAMWKLPPRIRVISDIDNTAIEQELIAPIRYVPNGRVIPRYIEVVKALTRGITTPTLISARPEFLELNSIATLSEKFNAIDPEFRFSVDTGTLKSVVNVAVSTVFKSKARASFRRLAEIKFENYKNLRAISPNDFFVFFGDDTQGDALFAQMLTSSYPNSSIAFIRKVSPNPIYTVKDEFYTFTSYYEVARKLQYIRLVDFILLNPPIIYDYKYMKDFLSDHKEYTAGKD